MKTTIERYAYRAAMLLSTLAAFAVMFQGAKRW